MDEESVLTEAMGNITPGPSSTDADAFTTDPTAVKRESEGPGFDTRSTVKRVAVGR